ncbi:hypothetical protein HOLleu_34524 [Holothuria leucospilota]|uniref:Uncharacterized protein n=1 Tax=Holothuria leucospilota TaxID=206669 RepID=A0A9Q0YL63_HOLLE|nr:hypothetical protein HOLleu_34524 [Holothuria leucospilota]
MDVGNPLDDVFKGTSFLCSVLVAPVKSESQVIIMYILNFEDISDTKPNNVAAGETDAVGDGTVLYPQQQQQPGYKWKRGRNNHRTFRLRLPSIYRSQQRMGVQSNSQQDLSQKDPENPPSEPESSMPLLRIDSGLKDGPSLKGGPSLNSLNPPGEPEQTTELLTVDGAEDSIDDSDPFQVESSGSLRNDDETPVTEKGLPNSHDHLTRSMSNTTWPNHSFHTTGPNIRKAASLENLRFSARRRHMSVPNDTFAKNHIVNDNIQTAVSESDLTKYKQHRKELYGSSVCNGDKSSLNSTANSQSGSALATKKMFSEVTTNIGGKVTQRHEVFQKRWGRGIYEG